jgi:hypothetical protein
LCNKKIRSVMLLVVCRGLSSLNLVQNGNTLACIRSELGLLLSPCTISYQLFENYRYY